MLSVKWKYWCVRSFSANKHHIWSCDWECDPVTVSVCVTWVGLIVFIKDRVTLPESQGHWPFSNVVTQSQVVFRGWSQAVHYVYHVLEWALLRVRVVKLPFVTIVWHETSHRSEDCKWFHKLVVEAVVWDPIWKGGWVCCRQEPLIA